MKIYKWSRSLDEKTSVPGVKSFNVKKSVGGKLKGQNFHLYFMTSSFKKGGGTILTLNNHSPRNNKKKLSIEAQFLINKGELDEKENPGSTKEKFMSARQH